MHQVHKTMSVKLRQTLRHRLRLLLPSRYRLRHKHLHHCRYRHLHHVMVRLDDRFMRERPQIDQSATIGPSYEPADWLTKPLVEGLRLLCSCGSLPKPKGRRRSCYPLEMASTEPGTSPMRSNGGKQQLNVNGRRLA
ncbi:hypothetical protein Droror1_Dr00002341 [Drosera rotundifolia]